MGEECFAKRCTKDNPIIGTYRMSTAQIWETCTEGFEFPMQCATQSGGWKYKIKRFLENLHPNKCNNKQAIQTLNEMSEQANRMTSWCVNRRSGREHGSDRKKWDTNKNNREDSGASDYDEDPDIDNALWGKVCWNNSQRIADGNSDSGQSHG